MTYLSANQLKQYEGVRIYFLNRYFSKKNKKIINLIRLIKKIMLKKPDINSKSNFTISL
jgi:hypothetical protein